MARLLPQVSVNQISHDSERVVAKALVDTLDDEWTVYHSYPWLRVDESRRNALAEGEADFVILHPRYGLLVLEVKGGDVRYDTGSSTWKRKNEPLKENPFDQARRNLHALLETINKSDIGYQKGRKLACTYGYAVIFPDCFAQNQPPPGGDPRIVLDADDLSRLGEKVHGALRAWAGDRKPIQMEPDSYKAIKGAILTNFKLVPSLARTLQSEGDSLLRLTEDQKKVIEGLSDNKRVAINGVAGSGKTLLALHQAQIWAREGKKTLLLCYNRNLAEDLRTRVTHENLTIRNFHALASEVCQRCGIPFTVPSEPKAKKEFWKVQAALATAEAFEDNPEECFDAVIVDEAQDFENSYWLAVGEMLRGEDSRLFYLHDHSQTLYTEEPDYPRSDTRYNLRINCRNTEAITATCASVIKEEIGCLWSAPAGEPPEFNQLKSVDEYQPQIEALLGRLLKQEKLSPSQIAILRPFKASPFDETRMRKVRFTESLKAWTEGHAVWSSTIRSFKGLESEVLILIDLPKVGERYFDTSDLYVACSRARLRLYVFTLEPSLKDYFTSKELAKS